MYSEYTQIYTLLEYHGSNFTANIPQIINEFVITRLYCTYVHEIQGTIQLTHTMEITVVGSFDDGLHWQAVVDYSSTYLSHVLDAVE